MTIGDGSNPTSEDIYVDEIDHEGSQTVVDLQNFKTENNLSPDYFTEDVRMVIQMFSIQQQTDLSDNIIFIEFHGNTIV